MQVGQEHLVHQYISGRTGDQPQVVGSASFALGVFDRCIREFVGGPPDGGGRLGDEGGFGRSDQFGKFDVWLGFGGEGQDLVFCRTVAPGICGGNPVAIGGFGRQIGQTHLMGCHQIGGGLLGVEGTDKTRLVVAPFPSGSVEST